MDVVAGKYGDYFLSRKPSPVRIITLSRSIKGLGVLYVLSKIGYISFPEPFLPL